MKVFLGIALVLCALPALGQRSNEGKDVCRKDNGFFAHEHYCDYFYECVEGEAHLRECPNGLAFSGPGRGLVDKCDYPHRVGCPDPENGREMGQKPLGSGSCPYLYGIFPHDRSCTRYWLCWNGTGTVQMCPFSLLYNEVEHACDWPEKVPGCQQHPLCKGTPNGVKPIQSSCVRYWLCMGGYPTLQRCPAGLAFSQDSLRCDWSGNVPGCEPTPSPDDDDEESLQTPTRRHQNRRVGGATEEESTIN